MQSRTTPEPEHDDPAAPPAPARKIVTDPDFSGTPQSISELVGRADFPQCALGAYIDIQGFAGVVVEIVGRSIKVRPPEGSSQRFNASRLKTIYASPVRSEPLSASALPEASESVAAPEPEPHPARPEALPRTLVADPDFTLPIQSLNELAARPDFPQCALRQHVEIVGYAGVVVGIVKGSLKIQSQDGITRSYNAEVLRKLYGKK